MITDNDVKKLKKTFATRDDLNGFATKDDLRFGLNNLREEINDSMDQKFTDFRSDIFNKLDQVIGELKTNREEREVIAHKVSNHEDRLNIVEVKLKLSP